VRGAVAVADAVLVRLRIAPLRVVVEGVPVRGFLRHRSFLAEAARPRTTYAQLFLSLLRPGTTVVDGGAHVGLYSLLAARRAERVFAVEPDAYNLAAPSSTTPAARSAAPCSSGRTRRRTRSGRPRSTRCSQAVTSRRCS
jgi:hypothetical protein